MPRRNRVIMPRSGPVVCASIANPVSLNSREAPAHQRELAPTSRCHRPARVQKCLTPKQSASAKWPVVNSGENDCFSIPYSPITVRVYPTLLT